MTEKRKYVLRLVALTLAVGCLSGCQMHRWVFVKVEAGIPGATVRSKGLPSQYQLQKQRAPVGHFIACTPADMKAEVLVSVPAWSYIVEASGHPQVRLVANREALSPFCANTMEEARRRPFVAQKLSRRPLPRRPVAQKIVIVTDPAGATVIDDQGGKLLGRTPLSISLDGSAGAAIKVRWVRVRLTGYRPERVQLRPGKRTLQLRLKKLPPAAAPRKNPPAVAPGKKVRRRPPARPSRVTNPGPPELPATRPRD